MSFKDKAKPIGDFSNLSFASKIRPLSVKDGVTSLGMATSANERMMAAKANPAGMMTSLGGPSPEGATVVPSTPAPTPKKEPVVKSGRSPLDIVRGLFGKAEKMGESATTDLSDQATSAYEDLKKDLSSGTVAGGFHAVSDVGRLAFAPLSAAFNALTGSVVPKATEQIGEGISNLPGASDALNKANDVLDKYPDAKRAILEDAPNLINMASLGLGIKSPTGKIARTKVQRAQIDAQLRNANIDAASKMRNSEIVSEGNKVLSIKELAQETRPLPAKVAVPADPKSLPGGLMPKSIPFPIKKVVSTEPTFSKNITRDVVPRIDKVAGYEVTRALELTQGDVSNIFNSTGHEVGRFIADNNLIGANKQATLQNIESFYETNYKAVRKELAKVNKDYGADSVPRYKEALTEIKKQIQDVAGLQAANKEVDALLGKRTIGIEDVQNVKELMDEHFSLYKAIGDVKEGVAKSGLANIRGDLKTFIEKEVKQNIGIDVGELNNKVATSRSLIDAIETRSTRGLTQSNLKIGDLGFFGLGFGMGGPLGGAALLLGKKIYESPTFKLRFAKWLDGKSDATKLKVRQDLERGRLPQGVRQIQSSSKGNGLKNSSTGQTNPAILLNTKKDNEDSIDFILE